MTRPLAAAISSARATTVVSRTRPVASFVPRRSTRAGNPAHPMATLSTPARHGRPNVSVITTPTSMPAGVDTAARIRPAVPSGSSGRRERNPSSTLEASTPALAQTSPCRVSAMTMSQRRATTRRVSRSTHAALPSGCSGTTRPSAFETTFWVTTRMSLRSSLRPSRARAWRMREARSSPARTSGMVRTGMISSLTILPRRPRRARRGRHERPPRRPP